MKSWLALLLFCSISFLAAAQNEEDDEYDENYEFPETKTVNINLGLGLGLDYGGIGGKLSFVPTKRLALFGAIGYNFNGAGYNGGAIIRFIPDGKVCPYFVGMYGYNAVLVIEGASEQNKTYYGASIGGGIELHRRDKPNFWNFGMLIPFRSQEYRDDIDAIQSNPNYELSSELLPISISVGYHFGL
jgi:hypothetical protein